MIELLYAPIPMVCQDQIVRVVFASVCLLGLNATDESVEAVA
ncbi:MAG: hypothetical protein WAO93_02600 [Orrella sp.]